jgi:hypothetical protein
VKSFLSWEVANMAKELVNPQRSCVAGKRPEVAVKIGHSIVLTGGAVLHPEPEC